MRPTQNNIGMTPSSGPLSPKDANVDQATTNSQEQNEAKSQLPRTRVPPSFRAKAERSHDAMLASSAVDTTSVAVDVSHTVPSVEQRGSRADDLDWVKRHIVWLKLGAVDKDMGRIEAILKAMKKENLRFDREPVIDLRPDMEKHLANIVFSILKSGAPAPQVTRILITMIELGCDPTARTRHDNTLLTLAASYGMTEFVDFLLRACQKLDKHALNIDGKNAAMWAHAHGHADALSLLVKAGVKLQPSNPALNFYKANIQRFAGDDAAVACTHLSTLLDGTHFINLPDETGKTLIFHAVLNQDVETVRFLCQQQDFPDLTRLDHDGNSVFDYLDEISDAEIFDAMNPVLEMLLMETTEER